MKPCGGGNATAWPRLRVMGSITGRNAMQREHTTQVQYFALLRHSCTPSVWECCSLRAVRQEAEQRAWARRHQHRVERPKVGGQMKPRRCDDRRRDTTPTGGNTTQRVEYDSSPSGSGHYQMENLDRGVVAVEGHRRRSMLVGACWALEYDTTPATSRTTLQRRKQVAKRDR